MQKVDPKMFFVTVQESCKTSQLGVETYRSGETNEYLAFDFRRYSPASDYGNLSIPSNRVANFQEQLRVLNNATVVSKSDRNQEVSIIKNKLEEAYGETAKIDVKDVSSAGGTHP